VHNWFQKKRSERGPDLGVRPRKKKKKKMAEGGGGGAAGIRMITKNGLEITTQPSIMREIF
jgi:hypothetical protein